MVLPANKTKIVCTIGPASDSPLVLEKMIHSGMNIARLNFSHGDFESHRRAIENLRSAAAESRRRIAVMADLPGPKMRIGRLKREPIELKRGDMITLTTEEITGDERRISVTFSRLPRAVRAGDRLFLNDGFIELEVSSKTGDDVACRVVAGGLLLSRKGLNLPGIDLGISAFTARDRECLRFAMEQGLDAVSQSFVETAADILSVREAAAEMGHHPFVIAKIERAGALDHIDDILAAADGIMIARGDLGVEIPIEKIAVVQKQLMEKANRLGKPVITATQMLESMTSYRRPTRAEATDVANAILDGTDCVMLSGESAIGKYPVEAVQMLAKIAAVVEPHRPQIRLEDAAKAYGIRQPLRFTDLLALSVDATLSYRTAAAVIVPTNSGLTARNISRFRFPVWIAAVSTQESTCQSLQFSYGVSCECVEEYPEDWKIFARDWLKLHGLTGDLAVVTTGPSEKNPNANYSMQLIDLRKKNGIT
jgi:pyruvate kinase